MSGMAGLDAAPVTTALRTWSPALVAATLRGLGGHDAFEAFAKAVETTPMSGEDLAEIENATATVEQIAEIAGNPTVPKFIFTKMVKLFSELRSDCEAEKKYKEAAALAGTAPDHVPEAMGSTQEEGGTPADATAELEAADPERSALMALFRSTNGPGWKAKDNWGSAEPLATWHGVEVDADGHVQKLQLAANRLTGEERTDGPPVYDIC